MFERRTRDRRPIPTRGVQDSLKTALCSIEGRNITLRLVRCVAEYRRSGTKAGPEGVLEVYKKKAT
jgi:hypothetical protein